jgi:hypothetical protein
MHLEMVKQWKKCKVCQIGNKCCQEAWKLKDAKSGIKRLLFLFNFYGIDLEVIGNWNYKLNDLNNIVYFSFFLKWIQRYVGLELQVFSCLKVFEDCFPRVFWLQKALSEKEMHSYCLFSRHHLFSHCDDE